MEQEKRLEKVPNVPALTVEAVQRVVDDHGCKAAQSLELFGFQTVVVFADPACRRPDLPEANTALTQAGYRVAELPQNRMLLVQQGEPQPLPPILWTGAFTPDGKRFDVLGGSVSVDFDDVDRMEAAAFANAVLALPDLIYALSESVDALNTNDPATKRAALKVAAKALAKVRSPLPESE